MKTYTICGSMRFAQEMRDVAYRLEAEEGQNVLQCVYADGQMPDDEALRRLTEAHYRKIDMSDGIYVVNPGGYVGESVQREITYAQERGKEVRYHRPVTTG